MTIEYESGSLVPHFSLCEMDSMARMMANDLPHFFFDPAYAKHIEQRNGGKPIDRYFETRSGMQHTIERFLNYADIDALHDRNLQELNANALWALIDDRLGIYLLPFASTPGGDYLCFDYASEGLPQVVLWRHEWSVEDSPHCDDVAGSFSEFVAALRRVAP